METLAIIGLVGNIVQFIDFSGKLISKSTKLHRSSEGALAENIDTETATNHLVLLNSKLRTTATATGDSALESLCKSCGTAADELLAALEKVKKSMRKALRSVWNKEEELERQLARFREELKVHVVVNLREQVCQFMLDQSHRLEDLDLATTKIVDPISEQQDVFQAAHSTQIALMGTIHGQTANLFPEGHCLKFAIIGLGGVGKTQIALELAYRTRDRYPECSVFWVTATSAENLQRAYLGIAQQLQIPGREEKREDIKELVQHYPGQENAGQWLLILNNADDLDMWFKKTDISTNSTRLIDFLPRSSKGSIVFTTRSQKAASKFKKDLIGKGKILNDLFLQLDRQTKE
ncbi:hypothetical protein V2W45_1503335 [Cenococcum geophilum]